MAYEYNRKLLHIMYIEFSGDKVVVYHLGPLAMTTFETLSEMLYIVNQLASHKKAGSLAQVDHVNFAS